MTVAHNASRRQPVPIAPSLQAGQLLMDIRMCAFFPTGIPAISLPTSNSGRRALVLVSYTSLYDSEGHEILIECADFTWTVSNGNCGFMSRYRAPRCHYVYRDNDVECDLDCDGSYEAHMTYAEWEAMPALAECPLVAA